MRNKLNQLINTTSSGSIVLQSWLTKQGITPSLAQRYTQSQWLTKLRAGVYARPGREPNWADAVFCLQNQLDIPLHLAGLSSLQQQGKAQYLQLKDETVWLSTKSKASIPTWFKAFPNADNNNQWLFVTQNKLNIMIDKDTVVLDVKGEPLTASSPELAAYEVLQAMPKLISFEHTAELFQGLVNLSPKKVMSLLQRSQSVRNNRLYLFFAHYYQHPWIKRIDESSIKLGSGKRQIVRGGKLDKKYNITVPEKFIMSDIEHG